MENLMKNLQKALLLVIAFAGTTLVESKLKGPCNYNGMTAYKSTKKCKKLKGTITGPLLTKLQRKSMGIKSR